MEKYHEIALPMVQIIVIAKGQYCFPSSKNWFTSILRDVLADARLQRSVIERVGKVMILSQFRFTQSKTPCSASNIEDASMPSQSGSLAKALQRKARILCGFDTGVLEPSIWRDVF